MILGVSLEKENLDIVSDNILNPETFSVVIKQIYILVFSAHITLQRLIDQLNIDLVPAAQNITDCPF